MFFDEKLGRIGDFTYEIDLVGVVHRKRGPLFVERYRVNRPPLFGSRSGFGKAGRGFGAGCGRNVKIVARDRFFRTFMERKSRIVVKIEDLALTMTAGLGVKGVVHLLDRFGSAERIFVASEAELRQAGHLRGKAVENLRRTKRLCGGTSRRGLLCQTRVAGGRLDRCGLSAVVARDKRLSPCIIYKRSRRGASWTLPFGGGGRAR